MGCLALFNPTRKRRLRPLVVLMEIARTDSVITDKYFEGVLFLRDRWAKARSVGWLTFHAWLEVVFF
jgi:hypothetical protein